MSAPTTPPILIRRWTIVPGILEHLPTRALVKMIACGPARYRNTPGWWEVLRPAVTAELARRRGEDRHATRV